MVIAFSVEAQDKHGPDVTIHCPACGRHNVVARTLESTEVVKLLFFIPFLRLRNSAVRCLECEEVLYARVPIRELAGKTPEELEGVIRYHASKAGKIMTVFALLTCLVPIVGLIAAVIAMILVRGTRRWPVKVAWISMILAVVVTVTVALAMCIE